MTQLKLPLLAEDYQESPFCQSSYKGSCLGVSILLWKAWWNNVVPQIILGLWCPASVLARSRISDFVGPLLFDAGCQYKTHMYLAEKSALSNHSTLKLGWNRDPKFCHLSFHCGKGFALLSPENVFPLIPPIHLQHLVGWPAACCFTHLLYHYLLPSWH